MKETTRCRSSGMTGVDGAAAVGVSWPSSAISASTCCMLCRRATSGLGMPGVTTVVGTGCTVAHPASSPRTRSAAETVSRISSVATRATRCRTRDDGPDAPQAAHVRRGPTETERGRRRCGRLAKGAYAPMCAPACRLAGRAGGDDHCRAELQSQMRHIRLQCRGSVCVRLANGAAGFSLC